MFENWFKKQKKREISVDEIKERINSIPILSLANPILENAFNLVDSGANSAVALGSSFIHLLLLLPGPNDPKEDIDATYNRFQATLDVMTAYNREQAEKMLGIVELLYGRYAEFYDFIAQAGGDSHFERLDHDSFIRLVARLSVGFKQMPKEKLFKLGAE